MSVDISSEQLSQYIKDAIPLLILDMRSQKEFMAGHIPGSANAKCASMQQKQIIMSKIPRGFKIVLIDADGIESSQNATMMAKFGFDACHLKEGIAGWNQSLEQSMQETSISNDNLWNKLQNEDVFLLDVREPQEFAESKIAGAVNVPLSQLFMPAAKEKIPTDKKIITICSHGNRSMVATFALAKNGLESTSLEGGMAGWNQVLVPTKVATPDDLTIIQIDKIGKGCLSHIVASKGKAIVIDATYPPTKIVEFVQKENLEIIGVIDTHQHADHVSAAKELSKITGSKLYLSGVEQYEIQNTSVNDGDEISFGDKKIKVMLTPGHTSGSMTYIIDDMYVFSGDTLFIEGVGRPDLRDDAREYAANLYDTLHNKILQLPQNVKIFPTHHSDTTKPKDGIYYTDISSAQKLPLLNINKEEFVNKIAGITTPRPMNYSIIIKVNKGLVPIMPQQVPDLEMGPNRCSIKT